MKKIKQMGTIKWNDAEIKIRYYWNIINMYIIIISYVSAHLYVVGRGKGAAAKDVDRERGEGERAVCIQ